MYGKRLTSRQGIIEDSAKLLASRRPYQSEKNYYQNAWTVMDEVVTRNYKRESYWRNTSPLAKTRLYRAIARKAVYFDMRFNFRRHRL